MSKNTNQVNGVSKKKHLHYNNCGNCSCNWFIRFFDIINHRIKLKDFNTFCKYGRELSNHL